MVNGDIGLIVIDSSYENEPLNYFKDCYDNALEMKQENIEAASISTVSDDKIPSSRFVNIKYIKDKFIFFSNYSSKKAKDIEKNNHAALLFFWNKTNTQIRVVGKINKSQALFSDEHFKKRSYEKNIAAIISRQSSKISNHDKLIKQYEKAKQEYQGNLLQRPDYWGGYELQPYAFEFWHGSDFRLNKRIKFKIKNKRWEKYYLQS